MRYLQVACLSSLLKMLYNLEVAHDTDLVYVLWVAGFAQFICMEAIVIMMAESSLYLKNNSRCQRWTLHDNRTLTVL